MDWLTELYRDEKRRMLAIANAIVSDRSIAEDIVHSAMVQLTQIGFIPVTPTNYAFRVVRNLSLDLLRTRKREVTGADFAIANSIDPISMEDNSNLWTDDICTARIENALVDLPTLYREVIELHLRVGLSFREISELTDTPLPTLASRYRRGIERLKLHLRVKHERA